jgi:hypothetical protein
VGEHLFSLLLDRIHGPYEVINEDETALAALDAALAEPEETFAESLFRRSWEAHRAALAEPEPTVKDSLTVDAKREPATREQVFAAYDRNDAIGFWNYCYAWREAERFHGITKEDGK